VAVNRSPPPSELLASIYTWLGHSNPAVTVALYVHSQDDAPNAAAKTLGAVVTSFFVTLILISALSAVAHCASAQVGAGESGAPGRNRTCGLLLRRQTLYPLSYGGARMKPVRHWASTA
jgi:hypothetical protein